MRQSAQLRRIVAFASLLGVFCLWPTSAEPLLAAREDARVSAAATNPDDPTIAPLEYFARLRDAVESDAQNYFALGGNGPDHAIVYLVEGRQLTKPVHDLIDEGPNHGVKVDVQLAKRSRAELQPIIDGFDSTALYRQLGSNFVRIGFDLDTNTVQIGLVAPTPADVALIKAAYGDKVTITQEGPTTASSG